MIRQLYEKWAPREVVHKYEKWIKENVDLKDNGYGKCQEVTTEMVKEFPELQQIRGFYYCPLWGERMHWWCINEEFSLLIDPTAEQFPSRGSGVYDSVDEDDPGSIPTGKCPNCGGFCYNGNYCCSENCYEEYARYCMGDR